MSERAGIRPSWHDAAWVVVILGAISSTLFGVASGWKLGPGFHPVDYLAAGHAEAFRWAALTDLFSYYLPFLLVILAVRDTTGGDRAADSQTIAAAGFLYVIVGAIGAVLLAAIGAPLIAAHAQNSASGTAIFKALTDGVFLGLWQTLETVFAAVWWFGMARTWADTTVVRVLGYVLAVAAIVTTLARMLALDVVGWASVLVLVLLWLPATFFVGLSLRRRSM